MRILFISSNRIGDAVLTTGLLDWLRGAYPHARFSIVCGPVAADLFTGFPLLDELIVLKKQKWNGHWFSLWRQCLPVRWDLIVDLRNSAITRLLRSKELRVKPAHSSGEHKVIDLAGIFDLSPPPSPALWLDDGVLGKASGIVRPDDRPILAVGPAANWAPKQWPIERFAALACKLKELDAFKGARLMIAAAPHERQQVQPLFEAIGRDEVIDVIGYDLRTVAACLSMARLFVGNDSGLMHISAAVKTPTIGLFGPSDDKVYGPWGEHAMAIRTPESKAELFGKLASPSDTSLCLMESLPVAAVFEGCRKVLHLV